MELPRGVRFVSTDTELVAYYLGPKVLELKLHMDFIPDINLYDKDAEDLPRPFQHNNRQESFFFVQRMNKYPNGTRPNRSTPTGYWKATGKDKKIWDKGFIIGYKKTLVFYLGKAPGGEKTNWIMQEYRLNSDLDELKNQNNNEMNRFVLCKVYDRMAQRASEENGEQSGAVDVDDTSGEGTSAAGSLASAQGN